MLNTNLLCLFCLDDGWGVDEGLGCGGAVLGVFVSFLLLDNRYANRKEVELTSLISSTAKYASVGTPASFG